MPWTSARLHRLFLLPSPFGHRFEARRLQEQQAVDARPQRRIVASERIVAVAPPGAVGVPLAFECVDRLAQRGRLLRRRAQEPAFEQREIDGPDAPPARWGQARVGEFVETRQCDRHARAQCIEHVAAERDLVRARWPARGQQRMDPARKPLAFSPAEVKIVHRQHRDAEAA